MTGGTVDRTVIGSDVYPPIDDYGLIGNGHTAALVSSAGSIDWYCHQRFDTPSLFARILDLRKGGYWAIQPTASYRAGHRYIDDTNVLETRFVCAEGTARLIDFMPMLADPDDGGLPRALIRVVEGIAGEVELASVCAPRPDYGRANPDLRADTTALTVGSCTVNAPFAWSVDAAGGTATSRVRVAAGERVAFVLCDADADGVRAAPDPSGLLDATLDYWRKWAGRCSYEGPYRGEVIRSALALKLLIYSPTGAIVAAPTTSLPEQIGGSLNWDYRFTWLRDSSLTLYALLLAGYTDELDACLDFIARTVAFEKAGVKIMYTISSDGSLDERELDGLEGYRGSRPVRIGNEASAQAQLDVYGEVMDAVYFAWKAGRFDPASIWEHIHPLVEWVAAHWEAEDNGIWEVRSARRDFVYSKVMLWVALDRSIAIATGCGLPGDTARWSGVRDKIRAQVHERGWSESLGAFAQSYEDPRLDASNLRLSSVGFVAGDDPRMIATIDRTLEKLVTDGLCYRYRDAPGTVSGHEGAFMICTFWLVDALVLAGRADEAIALFENVARHASPLGLYAEELDTSNGLQLGNFPQALSHIGFISSAVLLAHAGHKGSVKPEHATAAAAGRPPARGSAQG